MHIMPSEKKKIYVYRKFIMYLHYLENSSILNMNIMFYYFQNLSNSKYLTNKNLILSKSDYIYQIILI